MVKYNFLYLIYTNVLISYVCQPYIKIIFLIILFTGLQYYNDVRLIYLGSLGQYANIDLPT